MVYYLQSVVNHGQKGASDGFETDSNNLIYVGNNELNAINIFNPANGTTAPFIRDPRINWVDTSMHTPQNFKLPSPFKHPLIAVANKRLSVDYHRWVFVFYLKSTSGESENSAFWFV